MLHRNTLRLDVDVVIVRAIPKIGDTITVVVDSMTVRFTAFRPKGRERSSVWSSVSQSAEAFIHSDAGSLWFALLSLAFLTFVFYWEYRRRVTRELHLETLETTREHLQAALWGSGDGLWDWNLRTGKVTRLGIGEMLGYRIEDMPATATAVYDLIHQQDRQLFLTAIGRHLRGDSEFFEVEYRLRRRDGSWCWVLDRGRLLTRRHPTTDLRIAGTTKDISARRNAEQELKIAANVFDTMNEGVLILDWQFRIVRVNRAFETTFGYHRSMIVGADLSILKSNEHDDAFYQGMRQHVTLTGHYRGEVWHRCLDGHQILIELDLRATHDLATQTSYIIGVLTDVTARRRAENELRYLANYDQLTGLPNRNQFNEKLQQALTLSRQQHGQLGLMFLDIDHFKHINDSKGHAYGDVLLQQVAARLRQSVDDSELVARLGGDEFTVLIDSFIDETDLSRIAHRILTKFREPFVLDGEDISISPSIGISLYPHHGEDATTLLRCADMALYRAKEAGRATYSFYDHDMQEHSLRRFNIESALRRALEKNELELYFQPRSTIRSGVISGYEALVRWRSSTLGAVPPDEFIAVAENIGVINAIGDWVLLAACSKAAEWHAQQLPSRISVNLSARQLQQIGLAERVQSILIATNFPPGLLEVEITESILISSEPIVRNNLTQLRRLGIKLALDDFGTGYSTFSYLKKHKFDTIKIARDFVKDIGNEESAGAIAVAIIELAHNLNMRVVAEGVETEAQYEFLRKVGCEEVQGYYVGQPDPEPTQYLRNQLKIFDSTH